MENANPNWRQESDYRGAVHVSIDRDGRVTVERAK
jgi:hypothetical protein